MQFSNFFSRSPSLRGVKRRSHPENRRGLLRSARHNGLRGKNHKKLRMMLEALILSLIYLYRYLIRPYLPMSCRFEPSCSTYAIEAIQKLGCARGLYKIMLRLLRCQPWCAGGYDPILTKNNEIKR